MTKPTLRGCLVALVAGLVTLYVGYVATFWAFGEAGPLYLVVLNITEEPVSVSFPPDSTVIRVEAGEGESYAVNLYHKETNFLYYLFPFLPSQPAVPEWVDEVVISDETGTEVWSADLRDRPDLWNPHTASWQITVYKNGGAWAVRMPLEG